MGLFADLHVWTQWWFYVGLAVALGATFVEAFVTKPQDAIVNSGASIAAYFSADRSALTSLWNSYLYVAIAVLVLALLAAALRGESFAKAACYQLAVRAGRIIPLGCAALFLESASRISSGRPGGLAIALGTVVLAASLAVDWTTLWRRARDKSVEIVKIVDARSPSVLVVDSPTTKLRSGDGVVIQSGDHESRGAVVAVLPGAGTHRAILAVDEFADLLMSKMGKNITLTALASPSTLVGLVAAGSTPTSILFDEIERLSIGDPLVVGLSNGDRLYQVSGMRLTDDSWSGSKTVVPRASATLLGRDDSGYLRVLPELPPAHETVRRPLGTISSQLPSGYHRIGRVKGTEYQIGVADDPVVSGHIAIVGMSGMGKTTLVSNICKKLGEQKLVVAVDTTGEYAQRLAFTGWTKSDFYSAGTYVYEPQGDETQRAKELVENAMTVSRNDYVQGGLALSRVICLEEAHTFVPEWNFCTRNQADFVNETARMVMQARKYALSFIVVTQRTAVLSKSVLSQCESYAVFRTVDDTSLSYLETVGGPIVREVVPSLGRYEMLCMGPAFNSDSPVIVSVDPPEPKQEALSPREAPENGGRAAD